MALKQVMIGGKQIWIEVVELQADTASGERFKETSVTEKIGDLADVIRDIVGVVTEPVYAAFEGSRAAEWSMELNLGFKAEGGVPFVAKGETNASVKITAKWKKA